MPLTIHIRNMVCHRCELAVSDIFRELGLEPVRVTLGEVILKEDSIPEDLLKALDTRLTTLGFERIDDKRTRLIEKIKNTVIHAIHHSDVLRMKINWSDYLAEELHYDYNYLSNLFSSVEGITLAQYIIRQKIEKAKELLFYDELSLSEIADRLDYSSVAHLSGQFKKVTGFSPSEFKKSNEAGRKPLDSIS